MTRTKSMQAIVFSALMLIQVLAPITYAAPSSTPDVMVEADIDYDLFNSFGLSPSGDLANGWFDAEQGVGELNLLHRDAGVVALEDWKEWTGQNSKLNGWYVLTHEYPIPSEWMNQLEDVGIDCFSFLPPNGLHCQLQSSSIQTLSELNVEGIVQLDHTDKMRDVLLEAISGNHDYSSFSYSAEGKAIVDLVLSGTELPEGIHQRNDITIDSSGGRFATVLAQTSGIVWLVNQGGIEFVDLTYIPTISNNIAGSIINADDVKDATAMTNANSSWNGLDGTGMVVTVADTGLDNGINNTGMHPDFKDHIKGILSLPIPASRCTWTGGSPGSCDDGASDTDGHGTHVAGSAVGDGTLTSTNAGIAPEAQLLFHAIGQGAPGSLSGIPNNVGDMFDMAVANGSRIHTNSWGSCFVDSLNNCNDWGRYTARSAQIDSSARTNDELVILFAAGNDGADTNADNDNEQDTLSFESTSKNAIIIGASENFRPSSGWPSDNISGLAYFSSIGPADDGRTKPDFLAPGTAILSTRSRSSAGTGNYEQLQGTSMATPIAAGSTALLLQHLIDNRNLASPSSSLVKAIFAASAHDMMGQHSSSSIGAGRDAPNVFEGNGRLDLWSAMNASFVEQESLTTGDELGWSFAVPLSAPDLRISLAYIDPAASLTASTQLVNDLDLAIKDPSGTWTNFTGNLNNLRVADFANPAQGSWEVHVLGTSVAIGGSQFFSLAMNAEYTLVNLTEDADLDGTEDSQDDCAFTAGTSTIDRVGCLDTDGDGYSDPTSNWSIINGADSFINDNTQWVDQDGDGYGDNPSGNNADDCITDAGTSTADRYGCPDQDFDTYSDPDLSWTSAGNGADSCPSVYGTSGGLDVASGTWDGDRNGCPDADGDKYSDPDPSGTNGSVWLVSNGADAYVGDSTQWKDTDGDGYGDNPPPALNSDACPADNGNSHIDRPGCVDTDNDGYSDADTLWPAHPIGTADAFPNDPTQWLDSDGDGYGDNQSGNNPDACVNDGAGSAIRSSIDRVGCPDSDEDGYSDPDTGWPAHPIGTADAFPIVRTQWRDTDSDGYGDNPAPAVNPDACVNVAGTSTIDRKGCPDSDGDMYSDPDPLGNNGSVYTVSDGADVWPNEPSQWADTDTDGYGDNPNGVLPDSCVSVSGTSTADRYGCTDSDGDTYSDPDAGYTALDGADFAPSDPLRWSDFDGDTYDDQIDDDCPLYWGNSSVDRTGCPDTDGDGTSDADPNWTPASNGSDAFKTDPTQTTDSDGDGFGDNATGNLADDCPSVYGDSWQNNTFGCIDTDKDGWADHEDSHVNDSSQWSDTDNDGFGDNLGGTTPDACINTPGNSTLGNRMGCPDTDGDGWDDVIDQLPNLANQWLDQDGDGYGDNATGPQPDACPGVVGNSTIDRYGCVDDDGDGMSNESDAFPDDPTRTQDSDGDGFDDLEDDCIHVAGNSTKDRNACPDTDGDGYSDPTLPDGNTSGWDSSNGADALPLNPTQWIDSDGDGYGDNATGTEPDACPSQEGYSNVGSYGCPDGDNDGTSQSDDAFPDEPTQWSDADGDGYGDNPNGTQPDNCTSVIGTSYLDVFGCPDADSDGASNANDLWINDPTQWFDSDGDGFGDNTGGTDGDYCPTEYGTAHLGNAQGCVDSDGDGYADMDDVFPNEPTQWADSDGDGFGDNVTSGASRPDHWVNDPTRNVAEADLSCTPENIQLDLAGEDYFSFSCTIVSALNDVTIRVEWQQVSSIIAATQIHVLSFTETTGLTQTVVFRGEGRSNGNFQMYVSIKEPGVDFAMDSDSVNLVIFDSRIVDENDLVSDQSSSVNQVLEMPIVQAMIGGLVLFFLMGMLIIRGNASKARLAEERTEHAREIIASRMARMNNPSPPQLRQAFGVDGRVPPPPPPPPPMP